MQGNPVSEKIVTADQEIKLNNQEIESAYPDYQSGGDIKRIHPLSSLKVDDKSVSLKEIKRMMQLAGIIK